MKAEKYIARLPPEFLEAPEFCLNPGNHTTTIKGVWGGKLQKALFQCLNSDKQAFLMLT